MAAHRTEVLSTDSGNVPACSCGWVGDDYASYNEAKKAANTHKITAMRGGNKDPRQIAIPGTDKPAGQAVKRA